MVSGTFDACASASWVRWGVWTNAGAPVRIPERLVRALLSNLLVQEGRPLSVDRLAEDLWNGAPPGNADEDGRADQRGHVQPQGERVTGCVKRAALRWSGRCAAAAVILSPSVPMVISDPARRNP
jgi:hypothetical protein